MHSPRKENMNVSLSIVTLFFFTYIGHKTASRADDKVQFVSNDNRNVSMYGLVETETIIWNEPAMLRINNVMIVGIDWNDHQSILGITKCFELMCCSCRAIVIINLYETSCIVRTKFLSSCALRLTRYVIENESSLLSCIRSKCQRSYKIYNYCMRTYRTVAQQNWRLDVLLFADTKSRHKEVTRCIKRHHINMGNVQDILPSKLGSCSS